MPCVWYDSNRCCFRAWQKVTAKLKPMICLVCFTPRTKIQSIAPFLAGCVYRARTRAPDDDFKSLSTSTNLHSFALLHSSARDRECQAVTGALRCLTEEQPRVWPGAKTGRTGFKHVISLKHVHTHTHTYTLVHTN